jgi:hypothetical protein
VSYQQVTLSKPPASKQGNSEVYIVCRGFSGLPTQGESETLGGDWGWGKRGAVRGVKGAPAASPESSAHSMWRALVKQIGTDGSACHFPAHAKTVDMHVSSCSSDFVPPSRSLVAFSRMPAEWMDNLILAQSMFAKVQRTVVSRYVWYVWYVWYV